MTEATPGLELDALESEGSRQTEFRLNVEDNLITFRPAWEVPWAGLIVASQNWNVFLQLVVPSDSRDIITHLPFWKMEKVVAAYRQHYGLCQPASEDRRLAAMVTVYGKAIRYDFWERGHDLAVLWKQRRWQYLLDIIDRLPRTSALAEAMAEDEQLADRMLARADTDTNAPRRPPSRRVSEYSAEVELLSALLDRVGEVVQAVAASAGAKPRKVTPAPRPVTAMERARTRRAKAKHRDVVARVLPQPALPGGGQQALTAAPAAT